MAVAKSAKQTPRYVRSPHPESTHWPERRTWPAAQVVHVPAPAPEQPAHPVSHVRHVPDGTSKNEPWPHDEAGKHRPSDDLSGREGGQVEHCAIPGPEHDKQSGWHDAHVVPVELVETDGARTDPDGHEATHLPSVVPRPPAHAVQKVAEPVHSAHELSQGVHVTPS